MLIVWYAGCGGSDYEDFSGITIATFNVQDFSGTDAYNRTAAFIKDFDVDIIFFQEIQYYDGPLLNTALANRGVVHSYQNCFSTDANGSGELDDNTACWSKYSIQFSEDILRGDYVDPISLERVNAPRYILRVKINLDNRFIIWFYGVHLKALHDGNSIKRRRAQAHALEEYIKNRHDTQQEYIVILGDMNTISSSEFADNSVMGFLSMKFDNPVNTANDFMPVTVTHLGADDWTHTTFASRLDHLILSPALYEKYIEGSVQVVHLPENVSDHFPVLLKIWMD